MYHARHRVVARILCFASGGLHIRQPAIQSSIIIALTNLITSTKTNG